MSESLEQLVHRRQRELGAPGAPLSARQVWLRGGGEDVWSYETVRRIVELGHHSIGDKIGDALAVAIDVPVSMVHAAAGQRPRAGKFELPRRADRLNLDERKVVVQVIDTILGAADAARPKEEAAPLRAVPRAARTGAGPSRGRRARAAQDEDAERP